MREAIIIKNGRVIDPSQSMDSAADVLVQSGKISAVGPGLKPPASNSEIEIIDATDCIVCPGLIDMHVHLREPGREDAETIASGAAAAAAGGFTAVACMPNTEPAIDSEAMIEFVYRQAARAGKARVYPIGAITKGRDGKELAEMGQMVRAGAVAFSDDGVGVADPSVMLRAMQYAAMFDKPIIQHCEDASLATGGCMNAGPTALRLGLAGIPAMAEEIMLQRDLLIAENTGARYHVAHISTAGAVELVREAKSRGVRVSTEVCPHHLLLTEECCDSYDPNYKMNPPLRSARDVEACIAGVLDGTIDCLVTDHAPHNRSLKELDFQAAPFGIVGLETALGLFIKALVAPGHLDWPGLIALMSTNPAKVLGLKLGTLAPGADADITIIDPQAAWTVDSANFQSKSRNTPFEGWRLSGRANCCIVGGQAVALQPAVAAVVA
ncbi:MAG TPA: dihydroorotase [Phycisphaerae bacterium]|nr:dihydroorotase [Phycisphaerae bacterium]